MANRRKYDAQKCFEISLTLCHCALYRPSRL